MGHSAGGVAASRAWTTLHFFRRIASTRENRNTLSGFAPDFLRSHGSRSRPRVVSFATNARPQDSGKSGSFRSQHHASMSLLATDILDRRCAQRPSSLTASGITTRNLSQDVDNYVSSRTRSIGSSAPSADYGNAQTSHWQSRSATRFLNRIRYYHAKPIDARRICPRAQLFTHTTRISLETAKWRE